MAQADTRKKTKRSDRKVSLRWTSDDVVEALLVWEQERAAENGGLPGAGNAARRILGLPQRAGIIGGQLMDPQEMFQLKAWLLDLLFRVYGRDLATALRLRRKQKTGMQRGVDTRVAQASSRQLEIVDLAKKLIADGKPKRSVGSLVSRKVGSSPQHVRAVLKKAKVT